MAGVLIGLISLAFIAVNVAMWALRSDRLTIILEKKLSDSIDGEILLGDVDLKLWSTFPQAYLEADDIRIVSHSLRNAPDYLKEDVTASDDSVAGIDHISLDINLMEALKGNVEIGDIVIDGPKLNLVVADADLANFDIIPSDLTKHHPGNAFKHLKGFKINSINIINAETSRYVSMLDETDIAFNLPDFSIDGSEAPDYRLRFTTEVTSPTLDEVNFKPLLLGANGGLRWDYLEPDVLRLSEMHLHFGDFRFIISTQVEFSADMSLNELDLTIDRLKINSIISHMPPVLAEDYRGLDTDLEFTLNLNLIDTLYVTNLLRVPSARMTLEIPDCELHYGGTHLTSASMRAHAFINGAELNKSVINIDTLLLAGEGFKAGLAGEITDIIENPAIKASLKSDIALRKLPADVLRHIPMTLSGRVRTDAGVNMSVSECSAEEFHRIILTGGMEVDDLTIALKSHPVVIKTGNARFGFGTTSSYTDATRMAVDSLLTMTLSVDTASVTMPGNTIEASEFLADLGNPTDMPADALARRINAMIRIGSFTYDAPDSIRVRFRDSETLASLSRYPEDPTHPEVNFSLTARRFTTRGRGFGVAVSQPVVEVKSHMLPDSVIIAAGHLPPHGHVNRLDSIIERDIVDWNLTTALEKLLIGWDIRGTLKSNAGFVFAHDFPLRQRASAINLTFNTDSVEFNSLRYTIGRSVFDVTGTVSNMTRSFTSASHTVPLVADLNLHAPLVDVNELLVTSLHETSGSAGPDPDYTEDIYEHHVTTDTTASRPLIIPRNITADLKMLADTVIYSDLTMHGLSGSILMANSALNLHNLNAATPVGGANLSALYWAPDTANMRFGMGLELTNFELGRTLRLIPALGRMLPALRGFTGTVDAQMAATTDLTPDMGFDMSTLKGTVKLEGDSLALVDPERFKSLSRWLMFHDRNHIDIDHIDLEMVIDNRRIDLFPFIFDIDRYRLGVMGSNNLDMNLNYHVSVLKSPIPFKFGINITGPAHDPKIRLGGAKIKESTIRHFNIADSTFVNLLEEINTVFALGSMSRDVLKLPPAPIVDIDQYTDSLSADEQKWMEQEGWLKPDSIMETKRHHKHHFWIF